MTVQASSPFIETSAPLMQGLGIPIAIAYDSSVLLANTTITLTPVLGGTTQPQPFSRGRLRIKSSAVNAATTIAIGALTGTDGTNTVILKQGLITATVAAAGLFDVSEGFCTDLQLVSVSFVVTLGGGTTSATIMSELFATP